MCCPDPEICLPQHKHCQQNSNTNYTVAAPCKLTVHAYHCHTECHDQIHFKVIDQNVPSFLFGVCGAFDQLFGAGRAQL